MSFIEFGDLKYKHHETSFTYFFVFFFFLTCLLPVPGKSYTLNNEARIYTVYSDLHQYRYEFVENGEKGVVIVKPEVNQTFILMPAKMNFIKTTCDDFNSLLNDPVQASLHFKESQKEKLVGNEQMKGCNYKQKEQFKDTNT